jgi:hypothetical protein
VSDNLTDSLQSTTEIEMLEATERWSAYRLADGTTLRLKPVVIAVFRAVASTPKMVNPSTT